MLLARARQLEGVLHDPVDAFAREDRLLHHHLALGAFIDAPADVAVLAFGVLADDDVVDVPRLAAGERAGQSLEKAYRPQVDVKIEQAPEVDEQAPDCDVIGHQRRIADGAEIHRIEFAQDVRRILGTHPAVGLVPVAAPRELLPLEADAVLRAYGLQDAHAFRDYFAPDAIPGDDRDLVLVHEGNSIRHRIARCVSRRSKRPPSGALSRCGPTAGSRRSSAGPGCGIPSSPCRCWSACSPRRGSAPASSTRSRSVPVPARSRGCGSLAG